MPWASTYMSERISKCVDLFVCLVQHPPLTVVMTCPTSSNSIMRWNIPVSQYIVAVLQRTPSVCSATWCWSVLWRVGREPSVPGNVAGLEVGGDIPVDRIYQMLLWDHHILSGMTKFLSRLRIFSMILLCFTPPTGQALHHQIFKAGGPAVHCSEKLLSSPA